MTPDRGTHDIVVRVLGCDEAGVLSNAADDVFDEPIDAAWCAEFFADPRHHIAVALHGATVIGFASGVHYVHPDKPTQLFVNEVGVAEAWQRQGIGRRLMQCLLAHASALGCESAWVLTDATNDAARGMYASAGGTEQANAPILIEFRT